MSPEVIVEPEQAERQDLARSLIAVGSALRPPVKGSASATERAASAASASGPALGSDVWIWEAAKFR